MTRRSHTQQQSPERPFRTPLAGRARPWIGVAITAGLFLAGCRQGSSIDQLRRDANPEALKYLVEAQDYFESGFYNNALILTDSAGRLAPELADVWYLRGSILSAMRQFDQAKIAYDETLELDPDYPGVYLNLGNIDYILGEPRTALESYRKEKGEAAESAEYLVQLGRAYADLGIADSARSAYEAAIAADESDPTAHMWLGQLLEDQGELEEALQFSQKGLDLSPDNIHYAYVVGVQRLRNEDLSGAVEMLEGVTESLPWHYAAHYNLGQALIGLGQRARGAAVVARADTLLKLRRGIERWEELLASNSQEPMLWVNYGNALRMVGRVDEAIHALSVAFSLRPDWLEVQNNIANLLLARGDTLQAIARYEDLLTIDSTLTDIWLNLGTVHAISGDYDEARSAWQTALRQDPEHPEARRYLSELPGQ